VPGNDLLHRSKRAVIHVVLLVSAVCLFSCSAAKASGEEASDAAGPPSFGSFDAADDRSPLEKVKSEIDRVCSQDGCHGGGVAGLGLHANAEFDAMINVTSLEMPPMLRVRPGDPERSYVYRKIACEGGIVNECMPLGSVFDPRVKQMFHDWIEAGAPTE
jgi:hypothetical protein